MWRCLFTFIALWGSFAAARAAAGEPLLRPGDTLALVGGTLIERMQASPWLEAELQVRRSDWQLRLRNLGWSGDDVRGTARKVFETDPEKGFQRLQRDLQIADPSVVLVAYGFAEASNGAEAAAGYEAGLQRLAESLLAQSRRVILLRPFAMAGVRTAGYAEAMAICGQATDRVGQHLGVPVLSVSCDSFTTDGLLPDEAGYRQLGRELAQRLTAAASEPAGTTAEPLALAVSDEPLLQAIRRKDELFFHRHRPQNETYLFLFRKHEQGNNAAELKRFEPLIDQAEQAIWQRAQALAVAPASP